MQIFPRNILAANSANCWKLHKNKLKGNLREISTHSADFRLFAANRSRLTKYEARFLFGVRQYFHIRWLTVYFFPILRKQQRENVVEDKSSATVNTFLASKSENEIAESRCTSQVFTLASWQSNNTNSTHSFIVTRGA